jgi:3-deoxy-manno-octulosonate cytidylyltransferase (CMP-KDO synthetase)
MKVFALIPARYGSTRFPGKPLAFIAGQPMIQHVYRGATACPEISDVFVTTDDERIFRCVKDFGGKAIMTKPEHLSGTDRIAEAVQRLGIMEDDVIVNIQGDQPFFQPAIISTLIAPLKKNRDIPMSTLKYRITRNQDIENTNVVKVVTDHDGFALYFSRYPIPFFRDPNPLQTHYKHIGIYAFRKDFLITFSRLPQGKLEAAEKLEQLRALEYGFKIIVVETIFDSLEVDTPSDIQKIETEMQRFLRSDSPDSGQKGEGNGYG